MLRKQNSKLIIRSEMSDLVKEISDAQKKPQVVDVRSGDTVRVYQ